MNILKSFFATKAEDVMDFGHPLETRTYIFSNRPTGITKGIFLAATVPYFLGWTLNTFETYGIGFWLNIYATAILILAIPAFITEKRLKVAEVEESKSSRQVGRLSVQLDKTIADAASLREANSKSRAEVSNLRSKVETLQKEISIYEKMIGSQKAEIERLKVDVLSMVRKNSAVKIEEKPPAEVRQEKAPIISMEERIRQNLETERAKARRRPK